MTIGGGGEVFADDKRKRNVAVCMWGCSFTDSRRDTFRFINTGKNDVPGERRHKCKIIYRIEDFR